jgi:hypothetical protein
LTTQYGDGKAGQFDKSQAQRKLEHIWLIGLTFGFPTVVLLGICLGYSLANLIAIHFGWTRPAGNKAFIWIPLAALLLFFSIAAFCIRILRKPLNELMRERVKWLRGGQAEALIAWRLRNLGNEWHLFNNVKFKGGADLDHVLIGPGGVFCISTKSHKGTYTRAADGSYLLNSTPTDHVGEAKQLAAKLHGWLEVKLHDVSEVHSVPWVQSILAAPFTRIEFPGRQDKVWVLNDDELIDLILDRKKTLNSQTVTACAVVLQEITGLDPMPPA